LARLAWRSIWRNRRRTIITLASMVFGLFLVIFMTGIQEGTYSRMVDDAVRMQAGHVTLMNPGYLSAPSSDLFLRHTRTLRGLIGKISGVERTKGLIMGQGLAKSATGAVGVMVSGVEPSAEMGESSLPKSIRKGRYLRDSDGAEAVVGAILARRLGLEVGNKFVVVVNDTSGEMVEELCHVCGIFSLGSDEMDGYMIQVPVAYARRLYGLPPDALTWLGLVLHDASMRGRVVKEVAAMPDSRGAAVYPWERVLPQMYGLIQTKRVSNRIFLAFLMGLVLFTVFNTLLMSVLERTHEFGVMLALGATPARVRAQVFLEVFFLSLLGCLGGLLAGGMVVSHFAATGIDVSRIYTSEVSFSGFAFDKMLHPRLAAADLAWLGTLVFSATLVLGLYPVWKSARLKVAEVLR